MITVLERLLIRNRHDPASPKVIQSYALLCSVVSIFLNLFLFGGKLLTAAASGSVAVAADAFNNLADAGTCGAELAGFFVAGFGAGEIHPFGHGRIEWLMGLTASILVLFMGVEMAKSAVAAIHTPTFLEFRLWTLAILVISIGVKFYMYLYNRKIGARISSVAMKAKAYDCLGDLAATTAVLLSSLAVHFLGWQIDGWCGIAVAALILYAGLQALKETAGPLMGSAPDNELRETVNRMCLDYPEITGVYELMVHDYGFHRRAVSFRIGGDCSHPCVAGNLVRAASELSLRLRREAGCSATVQVELLTAGKKEHQTLFCSIEKAVRQIEPLVEIKDFRLVEHTGRVVATLNAVVPAGLTKLEDVITEAVVREARAADSDYDVDVHVKMSATANRHTIKKYC